MEPKSPTNLNLSPECEANLRKRSYYSIEIVTLINTIPLEQSRQVLTLLTENRNPENFSTNFSSFMQNMDNIPSMHRLVLLIRKYQNLNCCFTCSLSGIISALVLHKLNLDVPNPTLH